MTVEEIVRHYGSQKVAANRLGLANHASVSQWKRKGVPFERQCQLQVITRGALRADMKQDPGLVA